MLVVALAVPVLLGISLIVFLMLHSAGGDPAAAILAGSLLNARYLPKLYPGVPSPKKLAQRRKRFTLTVHRRDSRNKGADVQSRTLTVTFTPLR